MMQAAEFKTGREADLLEPRVVAWKNKPGRRRRQSVFPGQVVEFVQKAKIETRMLRILKLVVDSFLSRLPFLPPWIWLFCSFLDVKLKGGRKTGLHSTGTGPGRGAGRVFCRVNTKRK